MFPRARELLERVEPELPVVVERDRLEGCSGPLGDVLPGHEVRVVLELRDEDDVAGPEIVEAPGVGDEVDALGCAVGEDQLAWLRCVHEARDLLARAFVFGGGHLRERVDAAMDVRVLGLVERAELVQHLPRLVRAHRRVEVGEPLAPDLLVEDREIRAELLRVQLRLRRHGHPVIVPGGS